MARYGFMSRLVLSFLPLFGSERTKRVALGFLIKELRADRVRVYEPLLNRLTPTFGDALAELQAATAALAPVYGATMGGKDASGRRLELQLARATLHSLGLELGALNFDTIREERFGDGPVKVEELDEVFGRRMEVLSDQRFKACAEGLGNNRRLADLCAFDFETLLGPFRRNSPGRFGPCRAEPMIEGLLDLYFLIEGLDPGEKTERVLGLIVAESGMGEGGRAALSRLGELFAGPLKAARLGKVIRCAKGEPEYELRTARTEVDCLPALIRELRDSYYKARRAFVEAEARRLFEERMKGLFGDLALVPMEGYSEENAKRLGEEGFEPFRYVLPLRILRSFFSLHFTSLVTPAIGGFSIEADITDKGFKTALGDSVEAVSAVGATLLGFDQRIGAFILSELGPMLEREKREGEDRAGRLRASRLLARADEEADGLIQGAFSRLGALRGVLGRLAADLKEKSPNVVLNAHFLLTQKPELVKAIFKAGQNLDRLLDLLRNFAVDLEAAKTGLDKRSADGAKRGKPGPGEA